MRRFFFKPVFCYVEVLGTDAILAVSQRTVASALRVIGLSQAARLPELSSGLESGAVVGFGRSADIAGVGGQRFRGKRRANGFSES